MDSEDRIEKMVDIYVSAEAVRDMKQKKDKEDTQTTETPKPQQTGNYLLIHLLIKADVNCMEKLRRNKPTNIISVIFRKWFSEEQKLQSSCSVFGSALCSSADCSHSAVCYPPSRETK